MKLLALGAIAVIGSGYTINKVAQADKPVEIRVDAASEGIITVLVPNGTITVEGWRNDEIEIVGTLDNDDATITVESDHGHAELSLRGNRQTNAVLHIRVPIQSSLDVETTGADLIVSNLRGVLRFESSNGNLNVEGRPQSVFARSVTGNIAIPATDVPGFAHSEEGTVRLGEGTGRSIVTRGHGSRHYSHVNVGQHGHIGEHVADIVSAALESVDFESLLDYDDMADELHFNMSGSMHLDLEGLSELFDDLGDLFDDLEDELGDELEHLGEELETLGDDIRRKTRHRRR